MVDEKMQKISAINPAYPDDGREEYYLNENGMARLFAELYEDTCCYCPEKKSWFYYDGGKWVADVGETAVSSAIRNFTSLVGHYAVDLPEDKRKPWTDIFCKLGDRRFRDRLMKDAKDNLCVPVTQFDSKPLLLNGLNYTYNLATKKLQPHRWSDYITHQAVFEFNPKAKRCARWERFIDEVMCGDKDSAKYLQKCLGYSICGEANEACMFILYGKTTRNGKSTLLDTIHHLLGDYSSTTPVSLICKNRQRKNAEAASPTTAALKGKRFVTMAESNQYGKMDEEAVKQFTGGEMIQARGLYEKPFIFKPQFVLWLSCNDLPSVSDKSIFASERVKVFEFNRHFTAAEQDKDLSKKFREPSAMSAIFLWLVRGYDMYKEEGLIPPKSIADSVRKYEKENDIVGQFIDECLVPGGEISSPDLYKCFLQWSKTFYDGIPMSRKKFLAEFRTHSECYSKETNPKNVVTFVGIHNK